MSQDHVGLFDTPPTRRQIRISLAMVGLLFIALLVILVLPNRQLGEINSASPRSMPCCSSAT
ncbi:MAG TPA: hypothetical protein VI168_11080 [Croceibacterium sp.]